MFYVLKGLFNISDKFLVLLDILFEWREEFKRGVFFIVVIESKLVILIKKIVKVSKESCW